ncbi:restriction endonuclease subunit S [Acidipropionibacterium acidipropionici]|uniref:restriction endonuclease subunit S n=1 Tax=Acidipropionibacterium acidipropionici TaxID=1748 RepID=UPI002D78FF34|nr:restriction endonuclease subunit S [Acidipropionibacterium acidipropionici]
MYSGPSVLIGRKGTIDRPRYQETPFWTVDTLFYTEIEARCDGRFLYYLCTTIDWMALNEATGVPSLTGSRIESVEVRIPTGDEQRAIAQVLRVADAEIEALEKRLEATRQIKEGMMQELLTGRTRLV